MIWRARGTRPRMSGMLRQPSQSSTTSRVTTSISGLMSAISGTSSSSSSSSRSSSSSSRRGGKPATKMPQALVHLRRRQPDALVLLHRLEHVVDELLDLRTCGSPTDAAHGLSRAAPDAPCARSSKSTYANYMRDNQPCRRSSRRTDYLPGRCGGDARTTPAESGRSRSGSSAARAASSSISIRKLQSARSSATADDRIVLVRRAIEPGYGLWVFPGGYVDRGETVTAAALREAREEAGLDVRLDGLINIYSYPGRPIIIIVYTASISAANCRIDEESLEARLFTRCGHSLDRSRIRQHPRRAEDFIAGRTRPL